MDVLVGRGDWRGGKAMEKKTVNFGFRGWMLILYQAIAFVTYHVFTNYPLNILADFYGGAQRLSAVYSACAIIGVIAQLALANVIAKMKSVKAFGTVLGLITLVLGFGIMTIPFRSANIWLVCYALENVIAVLYATFSIGILVGQWFPRRKGTIMGIATFAFPLANGLIGPFAARVFLHGKPDVFGAFLPFFLVFIIGWLIGLIFIRDYPEQCGAFRDNDRTMTPEAAKQMMMQEIENKKTTVWTLGHTLRCRDFWLITIPVGLLLMFSIGMMTQSAAIIGHYRGQLNFVGGYTGVMLLIMIFGCIGSFVLGVLDTKFGTKKAIMISLLFMILAGVLGCIPHAVTLLFAMICLAVFMGASSNFGVSMAAQYWRREDFSSVFATASPIGNIICSSGPVVIARLMYSRLGYQSIFIATIAAGVIGMICILAFRPIHVKEVDDRYRRNAGKVLDDVLVGRE